MHAGALAVLGDHVEHHSVARFAQADDTDLCTATSPVEASKA